MCRWSRLGSGREQRARLRPGKEHWAQTIGAEVQETHDSRWWGTTQAYSQATTLSYTLTATLFSATFQLVDAILPSATFSYSRLLSATLAIPSFSKLPYTLSFSGSPTRSYSSYTLYSPATLATLLSAALSYSPSFFISALATLAILFSAPVSFSIYVSATLNTRISASYFS